MAARKFIIVDEGLGTLQVTDDPETASEHIERGQGEVVVYNTTTGMLLKYDHWKGLLYVAPDEARPVGKN